MFFTTTKSNPIYYSGMKLSGRHQDSDQFAWLRACSHTIYTCILFFLNLHPNADQLRRDNNNVPIATLWRQAIGRGHSRATLWSEPTTR